jgi:endonuclease YncB( thermonuclease family)
LGASLRSCAGHPSWEGFPTPVRLANADTPETMGRARCPEERALGERATAWVQHQVQMREVAVFPTWKLDKYRRALAYVTIDGEDLGELLVDQPWRAPGSLTRRRSS